MAAKTGSSVEVVYVPNDEAMPRAVAELVLSLSAEQPTVADTAAAVALQIGSLLAPALDANSDSSPLAS